jgi:hypothetical protein
LLTLLIPVTVTAPVLAVLSRSCQRTVNYCHRDYFAMSCVLPDRPAREASNRLTSDQEEERKMNAFKFASIVATGFAAALIAVAAPAQAAVTAAPVGLGSVEIQAGIDHHQWLDSIQPKVQAPPAPIIGNGR